MQLDTLELWVRRIGAVAILAPLGAMYWGLGRGLRRPQGRIIGKPQPILRARFYVVGSLLYFGLCRWLWRPLRVSLSPRIRITALILGALLFFPGLALVLWGRLTLGEMYNASSAFGVQLYEEHRLVTHGPYAFVRHPMYLGMLMAAAGGMLMYRTWTLVFLVANAAGLAVRARREETALAAEFGEQWHAYCRRDPGWFPRIPG